MYYCEIMHSAAKCHTKIVVFMNNLEIFQLYGVPKCEGVDSNAQIQGEITKALIYVCTYICTYVCRFLHSIHTLISTYIVACTTTGSIHNELIHILCVFTYIHTNLYSCQTKPSMC